MGTQTVMSAGVAQAHFPADTASVPAARRLVRAGHGDRPAETIDRLELIVTELAANAVRHTDSAFDVTFTVLGDTVRVEVADASSAPPQVRHPAALELGGRGLLLVEAYSDRWGYEPTAGGKIVWAEVDIVQ
jgi:anti-sigma regulatory factor (Ser/Thr protein kinase)